MTTKRKLADVIAAVNAPILPTPSEELSVEPAIEPLSELTSDLIPPNAFSGFAPIVEGSVPTFQKSSNSGGRSKPSTRRWRQPQNVRQFAAQVNRVATMVLTGEIELESARVYSGLARTVAQSMSTEVSRSRFLAQAPDLDLTEDE